MDPWPMIKADREALPLDIVGTTSRWAGTPLTFQSLPPRNVRGQGTSAPASTVNIPNASPKKAP